MVIYACDACKGTHDEVIPAHWTIIRAGAVKLHACSAKCLTFLKENPPEHARASRKKDAQKEKKISSTIYLRPEQQEALKHLSASVNVPSSYFIREGIDLILAKNKALL